MATSTPIRAREAAAPSKVPNWLSVATVILLASTAVASNIVAYVTTGAGLDFVIAGAAVVAIAAAAYPPPRFIRGVGIALAVYVAILYISLKNTWAGTDLILIVRSLSTITLSCAAILVGGSLRTRMPLQPRLLIAVQITCLALAGIVSAVTLAFPGLGEKNILGGVVYELAILNFIVGHARGERGYVPVLILGAVIILGALCSGHRLMIAVGAITPIAILLVRLVNIPMTRLIPILTAMVIAIGAIFVYTQYDKIDQFSQVDAQIKHQTGRSALSGRQIMWGTIVDAIIKAPMIGYGPTIRAEDVTGLKWSTHNAFLNVGLQTGVIGLGSVFAIFIVLARKCATALYTDAGAILSVYIAGVIVHNSFENVLFTNSFPIAVLTWTNIGFLVASCSMAQATPPKAAPTAYSTPTIKPKFRVGAS